MSGGKKKSDKKTNPILLTQPTLCPLLSVHPSDLRADAALEAAARDGRLLGVVLPQTGHVGPL